MYLPPSGTVLPKTAFANGVPTGNDGLPSFCSKSTRSCSLVLSNTEKFVPNADRRWLTEDTVDQILYAYPTVDIIVPSDWTGTLVINNNNESSIYPQRTVIVPFNGQTSCTRFLYATLCPGISLPSLSLNAQSAQYPIIFNGVRGGQFNNVNMNSVSGSFVARGAIFSSGSTVNVNIPMGDIIISANQQIETTVGSIYAATPPVVVSVTVTNPNIVSPTQLTISMTGSNFRYLNTGDFNLIVPNGTCALPTTPLPGLVVGDQTISFVCDFSNGIQSTGSVTGPILVSYFGGNLLSTRYALSFSASFGALKSILSASVAAISDPRSSSGLGCGAASQPQNLPAGNVCAVASQGTQVVPQYTSSNAGTMITMFPASINPSTNVFTFSSSAARSITLGSYQYSIGSPLSDYATPQKNPNDQFNTLVKSIAACPIVYNPQDPVTSGQIASSNPNYNIPYDEQQHLLFAVNQLLQGNVSFVVIKINGGGANLPGFFTLSTAAVYNVIDPAIISTLTFGLLDLNFSTVNVRIFACDFNFK